MDIINWSGTSQTEKTDHNIVAIASSAGGLTALSVLLGGLNSDFPAPILIVQHLDRHHQSMMADILSRRTTLIVTQAQVNERPESGHAYIAPPDHHLLVNPNHTISLTQSELVHFVRPSADLLFESVAASYKEHAIAIVLTGTGQDGAMGVTAIKKMGGKVIAQDPGTAAFPGMPDVAIQTGFVDYVLPLETISSKLMQLIEPKLNDDRTNE